MNVIYIMAIIFTYMKGYLIYSGSHDSQAVLWAFACGFFILLFLANVKESRFLHMRFSKIDRLKGEDFEEYLMVQFKHIGYRVAQTDASHDYGADLILKKHKELIVVQAKRYERNVGITAIQEAVGAVAYYGADRAMVITNQRFTPSAKNLARQNNVELWGREELKRYFHVEE